MRTIIFAALMALATSAPASDETKVASTEVWSCFSANFFKRDYETPDDRKVPIEPLAKILTAKCDAHIQKFEFARMGYPKEVPQDWYDRQVEEWKLLFMDTILWSRNMPK